ncbi:E3 ubiquitin-protein ligase DMA2 [Ceratobasidium sp. AG-Ba]|nr:E3 ubiquitin-protein ligase DMA2 [Ceratobasidium sp. AG-Ba]
MSETVGESSESSRSSHEWEQLSGRVTPGPDPGGLLAVRDESKSVRPSPRRARASISNLLQTSTPDMMATTTIPPADARSPQSTRQTILGFMGRRARSATTGTPPVNPTSPSPPLPSPNLPAASAGLGLSGVEHNNTHLHLPSFHRHPHPTPDATPDPAPAQPSGRLGGILRRRRSNGGDVSPHDSPAAPLDAQGRAASAQQPRTRTTQAPNPQRSASTNNVPLETSAATGPSHRLRLVPHLDPSARTLHFEPIVRDVREGGPILRIGRFTDRNGPESTKIAFKSKVVSRAHAEVWCVQGGKFLIRDTRSSSGTFLNHTRLSAPNIESRPQELHDGDIIQLGVDYQGGAEEIYRCVKIRVELGREWQREANEFNTGALKQLQTLQGKGKDKPKTSTGGSQIAGPSNSRKTSVADCCICLFPVAILQSLFIAPCSHCFHYKCIRPLLVQYHPGFSCPLCRTFADLEEDVEKEYPPSIYAPSVHAPSVHEAEGVAALVGALAGAGAVESSPKALPAVPADDASAHGSGSGSVAPNRNALPTGDSITDFQSNPDGLRSEHGVHSDGGSTPRGSSEDLRAAQREMGDRTLINESGSRAIDVPRTPERERDILNSATPLNNQFLTLTGLHAPALPSIPSVGNVAAMRGQLTSDSCSSVNVVDSAQDPYGNRDTESARYLLLDGGDDGDDGDDDDDELVVINGVKRMTVETEGTDAGSAGPSRAAKETGVAI